ncbi:hypothetical protein AB0N87_15830 [Streptomyces sp. NPDC093228]
MNRQKCRRGVVEASGAAVATLGGERRDVIRKEENSPTRAHPVSDA